MKPQLDHSLFLIGLLVISVLTIPVAGPAFESYVFPVLTETKVVQQTREDDLAVFHMHGTRHRPECSLWSYDARQASVVPAIVALVTEPGDPPEARMVLTPFKKSGATINRPPGAQGLGAWKVQAPVNSDVQFVITYTCHSLWSTTVELGPFRVTQ